MYICNQVQRSPVLPPSAVLGGANGAVKSHHHVSLFRSSFIATDYFSLVFVCMTFYLYIMMFSGCFYCFFNIQHVLFGVKTVSKPHSNVLCASKNIFFYRGQCTLIIHKYVKCAILANFHL